MHAQAVMHALRKGRTSAGSYVVASRAPMCGLISRVGLGDSSACRPRVMRRAGLRQVFCIGVKAHDRRVGTRNGRTVELRNTQSLTTT